jgi:hypothetical protein
MAVDWGSGAHTCPTCGTQAVGDGVFCPACGRPLNAIPAAVPPPPAPPAGFVPTPGFPPPPPFAPQGFAPAPGFTPPPAGRSSKPMIAALLAIGLVVVVGAVAVMSASGGTPKASSIPSSVAVASPAATTPAATIAATPSPRITPTRVPTAVPTLDGMPWYTFKEKAYAADELRDADTKAWNAASTPAKTAAAVKKLKADAQADLDWLKTVTPRQCYKVLYDDLVLLDNLEIKLANDWLAGKYTTINKSDVPAINAVNDRLSGEFSGSAAACS